jgi:phosphoribosyl 1,2-cyclic phosphodiesterase
MRVMPKALAALAGQALACIQDPDVIEKILTHLDSKAP